MRNPIKIASQWVAETREKMRQSKITRLRQKIEIVRLEPNSPKKMNKLTQLSRRLNEI